jgi:hypothetical protein
MNSIKSILLPLLIVGIILLPSCKEDETVFHGSDPSPKVSNIYPSDATSDIPINTSIVVTFDQAITSKTLITNPQTTACYGDIQLSEDGFISCVKMLSEPIANSTNQVFTVQPSSNLESLAQYKIKVLDGLGANSNYVTATGFETSQSATPMIIGLEPVDGTSDVPIDCAISVSFSKSMDTTSITTNSIDTTCSGVIQVSAYDFSTCVKMTGVPVASNDNKTFTVQPAAYLTSAAIYKTKVIKTAKDSTNEYTLSDDYVTPNGFTTFNSNAPYVVTTNPADATTDVGIENITLTVSFSETLTTSTVTTGSFTLSESETGNPVSGTVGYNGTTATFTPLNYLKSGTLHTATINTDVTDLEGNPMLQNHSWSFTTEDFTVSDKSTKVVTDLARNIALTTSMYSTTNVTFSIDTAPGKGTAVISGSKVQYTLFASQTGTDFFTYKANNSVQDTTPATVSVTIVNGLLIPDTGQTSCYNNTDTAIACPTSGQPFYGQDGNYTTSTLETSLNNNGDGTVTDSLTGLIWQRIDWNDLLTWSTSEDFCNSSPADLPAGDWRLPTIRELISILNMGSENPSAVDTRFAQTQPFEYWSSTLDAGGGTNHWYVKFDFGKVDSASTSASFRSRCVIGESGYTPDINIIDADTVADYSTGLIWQRGENGVAKDWEDALSTCENLGPISGKSDWRLPNYKELLSLVDHRISPPYETTAFPGMHEEDYWSSTPRKDSTKTWNVNFSSAQSGYDWRTNPKWVRCVRGGL